MRSFRSMQAVLQPIPEREVDVDPDSHEGQRIRNIPRHEAEMAARGLTQFKDQVSALAAPMSGMGLNCSGLRPDTFAKHDDSVVLDAQWLRRSRAQPVSAMH